MEDKIVVDFFLHKLGKHVDLELELDMTALELVLGLNQAYNLGLDTNDLEQCYLAAENPIALLRGNRTLREYGLRDGTVIHLRGNPFCCYLLWQTRRWPSEKP